MSYRLAEIDLEDNPFGQEHIATITLHGIPWQIIWPAGDLKNGRAAVVEVADDGGVVFKSYLDVNLCMAIDTGFYRNGGEVLAVIGDVFQDLISNKDFMEGGRLWARHLQLNRGETA